MAEWENLPELDETIISALKSAVGDEAFVGMAALFEDDLGKLCLAYREARNKESTDGSREVAHAIKGAAANIGLVRLSALAADMERGDFSTDLRLDEVYKSGMQKLKTV
jgi:HPt (histidine-containing phosphotransfer) domain-containing protein